jgi:AraC-like DNA-binding protein
VLTDYSLYPRHQRLGGHLHSVYHLVFTLEGHGILEGEHGRSVMVPGDILLINPGAKHVFHTQDEVVRVFAFNFYLISQPPGASVDVRDLCGNAEQLERAAETTPLENLFGLAVHGSHVVYDRNGQVWPRSVDLLSRLRDTVSDYLALTDNEQRRDGYDAYVYQSSLFLLQLLAQLIPERLVPAANRRLLGDPILHSIDRYLREHLDERYRLSAMAEELGYAPAYLCSHFSQQTGMTIGAYHNRLRTQKACDRLRSRGRSISQVGLDLGYSSPQHFSAAFRRARNMSPREYRRQSDL